MSRRIAYVEDKDATRESYAARLRGEGYEVTEYATKAGALDALRSDPHDLALLDVSHEGDRGAGYDICVALRQQYPQLPIIFLTNRSSEIDKISGLRLGADDYVSKADSRDYLVVRIETLFRRLELLRQEDRPGGDRSDDDTSEGMRVDDTHLLVHWKGQRIDLPLTQFWIVRALYSQPGQVQSHRELMKACKLVVEPNTITAHVKAIREGFRRADPDFNCIKTERGRGYRWVPPT